MSWNEDGSTATATATMSHKSLADHPVFIECHDIALVIVKREMHKRLSMIVLVFASY